LKKKKTQFLETIRNQKRPPSLAITSMTSVAPSSNSKRSYDYFMDTRSDNSDRSSGGVPKRVVRFKVDHESSSQEPPPGTTNSKQRRQEMVRRRQLTKFQNLKKGITSYDNWFSSFEIKKLHLECASDIASLETMNSATNIDEDSVLSLSRYFTIRRREKAFVQRQLYDVVQAIQAFETNTGLQAADLLASECTKFSKNFAKMAHWEGVCLHMQVVKDTTASK
jgi:hypothetical protein